MDHDIVSSMVSYCYHYIQLLDITLIELVVYIFFFFFKQKTAYEMERGLVGSEMCIRDRTTGVSA